jgi:hypothetical protein
MDTFTLEYYDLLSRALAPGQSVQNFLDDTMARKYNGLQLDGFAFEPFMQNDTAYVQTVSELALNAAAQYYDIDSPAIPDAPAGLKQYTGSIPRMKKVEYFNEAKIREMRRLEDRRSVTIGQIREAAYEQLFITVDKLIGGHTNALTFQRHQVVSTGKFTISAANNPKGINGVTLDFHVPAANKTTLSDANRWWTNAGKTSEGGSADPVKDMTAMVEAARMKGIRGHFEMEIDYLKAVLNHSAVIAKIGITVLPAAAATQQSSYAAIMSYEAKKERLEQLVGAPIKAIDSIVAIDKIDKDNKVIAATNTRAFEQNVVVFVPDGQIGTVKTVEPIAIAGGNYASFYGGKLLLTIGADFVYKCQSFNTEMTSLVIPNVPQYMWYLYPNNV